MKASHGTQQRLCHACGKPPHRDGNNKPIKMLRCSRCHAAWYHNVECQRKHYKEHKHQCRRTLSKEQQPAPGGIISPENKLRSDSLYHCENLASHGRSMIATQPIPPYTRIHPYHEANYKNSSGNSEFFEPIVSPVLITSERSSRCAHCFHRIHSIQKLDGLNEKENHVHLFRYCSAQCQKHGLKLECELIRLMKTGSLERKLKLQEMLTPITLLLYRIICAIQIDEVNPTKVPSVETTRSRMNLLQSNCSNTQFVLTDEEKQYRYRIAFTSLTIYQDAHNCANAPVTMDEMVAFTSKIMYNCFSITDGEQKTIGLGLYPTAAIINHSCTPNLVQTFAYGCREHGDRKPEVPKLVLTTCKRIAKGSSNFLYGCLSCMYAQSYYSIHFHFVIVEINRFRNVHSLYRSTGYFYQSRYIL